VSIPIITAHSARPGMADEYEDFLANRKIAFVRGLSSIDSYNVYRCGDVFTYGQPADDAPKYNMVAILEVNDIEKAREEVNSPEFEALRGEYGSLIVPRPGLYVTEKVEQRSAMSAEEYQEHRAELAGSASS
jgi:hypothetical protein